MIRTGPGEGLNSPSSGTSRTSSTASSPRTRCTASRAFSTRAGASRRSACSRASRSRASTMPWRTTAGATSRTEARSRSCGATPRRSWCSARPIRRWRTGCRSSAPTVRAFPGVVRVRPVSTLAPGECHASLADGRFERRQLGHYRAEAPDEAGGRARSGVGEPEGGSGHAPRRVPARRKRIVIRRPPAPSAARAWCAARGPRRAFAPGTWPWNGTFRLSRIRASRLRRRR